MIRHLLHRARRHHPTYTVREYHTEWVCSCGRVWEQVDRVRGHKNLRAEETR